MVKKRSGNGENTGQQIPFLQTTICQGKKNPARRRVAGFNMRKLCARPVIRSDGESKN
jgi:hypothetical protein